MSSSPLNESLATAVADDTEIDRRLRAAPQSADPDLVRTFRVISSIGAARRADPAAVRERGSRALTVFSAAVVVLCACKLVLTGLLAVAALTFAAPQAVTWPFAPNVLLFGLAGAVLLMGGARDRRARSLGMLFVVIASAFADPLVPRATVGAVATGATALQYLSTDAFLALALWLFVWLFPSEPKQAGARRIGRGFLLGAACLGLLLFSANAIRGLSLWSTPSPVLDAALGLFSRRATTLWYSPLLFAIAAPAIPFLVWKSRVETTENRRRVRFLVMALAFGLSPTLLAVIAEPFVPALRDPAWHARVGLVLYVALASIVPSTAYAVVVDRVMDLHLVLRKTLQYGLARSSVWCFSLAPLFVLATDIYRHRALTVVDYLSGARPLGLLTLSCVSFGVLTFRPQILGFVDRWFLREATDYTAALAKLERGFRTARSSRDVSRALKREIEQAVHPATTAVLLFDEDRGQLVSLESAIPPLPRGSALLDLLRSVRTEVRLGYSADGPVAELLPPGDREWLRVTGFQLFSPLVGSTGTLLGIVGLGDGRNGLPYTDRDCMLITAMSGQTALKLENSRLREHRGPMASSSQLGDEAPTIDWRNEPAMRCPDCDTMWRPDTRTCSCGATTVEAALPLVVRDKFRVDRFIGSGGTGVVYLAVDMALDRKVAIKTLPAIRLEHASRLHREARAMAGLRHPNLALIYGAEHWKGTPLLIFEYLEGGTLLDSLRSGPLELDEVINLGTLLADALDRVHASGVLHRDIKPSNIGYTSEGVPKLLDFGLAAILDRSRGKHTAPAVLPNDPDVIAELAWGMHPATSITITQQLVGTPLYLSPEALGGEAPQPSFDLWSLCLVLYESLAGRHPLRGEAVIDVVRRIRRGAIPDVRDFRPDCPAALATFLNDALSLTAARRPATAADLRARLQWLRTQLFPKAS